jgi:sorbitol/mannitol transport system permease protein
MSTNVITPAATPRPAYSPAEQRRIARREGWKRRAPLLPALILAIIVPQIPFLVTVWYSLHSWNLVRPDSERFVGLSNYADVFRDSVFRGAALNTVVITGSCVILAMLLGIGLALLLDRNFIGRSVVRTMIITPFLVMPVAGALVWKTTMLDPVFGMVNYVIGLVGIDPVDWTSSLPLLSVIAALVWQWTPFMTLLVLAGLQSQGRDVLEAAQVDGANAIRTFRSITMPHLRRYVELGVLLGAIYVVNTFDQIYLMTAGGPGTASANLPFYIYQRAFLGFDIGQAAAMGVVVVIGTILVATAALRLLFRTFMEEK